MLMMFLLLVTTLFAFSRFFQHLHFFFQVFTSQLIDFRDAIETWLWLRFRLGHRDDIFHVLFSLLLLVFGDYHVLKFIDLLQIVD
jgi:hypothetical protein